MAKQEFTILASVSSKTLPVLGTSIQEMIKFTLPSQLVTVNAITPSSYFSSTVPDPIHESLLVQMHCLPTPSPLVVGNLVELQYQAWLDGFQSIKYVHISNTVGTHFPLWLISFWAEVVDLQRIMCKPWISPKKWLQAEIQLGKSNKHGQLAEHAQVFLFILPWDSTPVCTMWHYLGPHMTMGSQQSDLLDALSDHIAAKPELNRQLCIKGLALSTKVMEAAAAAGDPHLYQTAQTFKWI